MITEAEREAAERWCDDRMTQGEVAVAMRLFDSGLFVPADRLAVAWDQGYETRAATLGMTKDPNPYDSCPALGAS